MAPSLKTIKVELKKALELFSYNSGPITGSNQLQFSKLNDIRLAIRIVRGMGLFESSTLLLVNSAIFGLSQDSMILNPNEGTQIKAQLDLLRTLIVNFLEVLDDIVPVEDPNSINIKIPDSIDDFSKLSVIARQIDFSIGQSLINSDINCLIHIESVENGSIWTNISLIVQESNSIAAEIKVPAAIYFLNKLLKSAIQYRKDWYAGTKLKEEIRKLKNENPNVPETQSLEDGIDKRTSNALTALSMEIKLEFYKKSANDDELLRRIESQVETLSDLLVKGVVITPSITSTEEMRLFFPTVMEQMLIEDKTREIEGPKKL